MKLLFDQHLSFKLAKKLACCPGSNQVKLIIVEAGDDEIWEYARVNGFTLVSKDSDYSERSALLGIRPRSSGCGAATNDRARGTVDSLAPGGASQLRSGRSGGLH